MFDHVPPLPPPQVQESVASCLPPLVPAIKEDAAGIVRNLLQLLLESDKYAERKGAAYGLAGLVKGLGILSLKQQEIMTTLTDAIQDKKNFRRREGWFDQPQCWDVPFNEAIVGNDDGKSNLCPWGLSRRVYGVLINSLCPPRSAVCL